MSKHRITRRGRTRSFRIRPMLEALERRDLLTAPAGGLLFSQMAGNDVLPAAQVLAAVTTTQPLEVHGAVAAGADVGWYRFDVTAAERISLALDAPGVVTLYDQDSLAAPLGYQMIGQVSAPTPLSLDLLPGTYFVAVSGAGNSDFNPLLAGSGLVGATGAYDLTISAAPPDFDPSAGLQLVRSNILAQGYTSAPLALNLWLSQPIDLSQDYVTILDVNQNDLTPAVALSPDTNDLVLTPLAPLDVGQYQVVAYDSFGNTVLSVPFSVVGREGQLGANAVAPDTLATAVGLQDLTHAGAVQVAGAIGNDPYYNPQNPDPTAANPSSQVNMYGFTVSGPGQYVLTAEAFAGRIGSTLDPALTLFRLTGGTTPGGGPAWQLVAGNDNSGNQTPATNGAAVLYTDPVLFAGLTAGNYVIAVSGAGNYADPIRGTVPGTGGVFDPNQSHSGTLGRTTGNYVLNLFVQPAGTTRPYVVNTSVQPGQTLASPPTTFTVQFSAPVDLAQLAPLGATANPAQDRFPAFIVDGAGNRHDLGLAGGSGPPSVATLYLLDRLTNGAYTLHLSGSAGLTDLAGLPLAGNDPSGDYVVPFTVTDSPPRPATLADTPDSFAAPTDLGVLFPSELSAGVVMRRDFQNDATPPQDQADYFRFTLQHTTSLALELAGTGLNVAGRPVLLDAQGNPVTLAIDPNDPSSHTLNVSLVAGTYTIRVGTWSVAGSGSAVYDLRISANGWTENPTALTAGPAPAYLLRLDSVAPAASLPGSPGTASGAGSAPAANLPQLVLPTQSATTITATFDRGAGTNLPPASASAPGAIAGLAAPPLGVAGPTAIADDAAPRLILTGTELPGENVAQADADGPAIVAGGVGGIAADAIETMIRAHLYYAIERFRLPQVMPGDWIVSADATASAELPPPIEVAAPETVQDAPPASAMGILAWGIALALGAGAGLVGHAVRSQRRTEAHRPSPGLQGDGTPG